MLLVSIFYGFRIVFILNNGVLLLCYVMVLCYLLLLKIVEQFMLITGLLAYYVYVILLKSYLQVN